MAQIERKRSNGVEGWALKVGGEYTEWAATLCAILEAAEILGVTVTYPCTL